MIERSLIMMREQEHPASARNGHDQRMSINLKYRLHLGVNWSVTPISTCPRW